MSWAVIKVSGKQYLVKPGGKITVNSLGQEVGKTVKFSDVLLLENGLVRLGTPFVKNWEIVGKIIRVFSGPKMRIVKFRSKSRYLRIAGFRSRLTEIEISKIRQNRKR